MSLLDDVRAQYPQYGDMSDAQLAVALRRAYYSDMPPAEYYRKVGVPMPGGEEEFNSTEGMGTAERVAAGAGASLYQTARGIGQMVGAVSQEEVDAAAQVEAPLMDTAGGLTGNILGHVGQIVVPAGAAIHAGSALPRLAKLAQAGQQVAAPSTYAGAAGVGALQSGIQPVATGESRLENMGYGAVGGTLGRAIPQAIGAAVRGSRRVVPNFRQGMQERQAAEAIEGLAQNPQALRQTLGQPGAGVIIPGTRPSLAEVSGDVGLYGAQRTMQSMSPEFNNALTVQGMQNNAARVDALRQAFGGANESAAQAIEGARDKLTAPLRAAATQANGVATERVIKMANGIIAKRDKRPAVQSAVAKVRDLLLDEVAPEMRLSNTRRVLTEAIDSGRRMSSADFDKVSTARTLVIRAQREGSDPAAVAAELSNLRPQSKVAQAIVRDAAKLLAADTVPVRDVHRLYNARQSIGDMLSGSAGGDSDAARAATRELLALRSTMDGQIRKVSPEYGQYLQAFRDMSREADRVRFGEKMLARSGASLDTSGNPRLLPAQFARAANDMDAVARQATGFRKASAETLLTPAQKQVVADVRRDLDRYANVMSEGKAVGSNTVQNLAGAGRLQDMTGPVAAGVLTGEPTSALAVAGLNQLRQKYGEATFRIVQEAMADPVRAAEILSRLPSGPRREIVRRVAPLLASGLAASSAAAAQPLDAGLVTKPRQP